MSYDIENIKTCNKVFYHLLQFGELKEEKDKDLYRSYCENEHIMNLVKIQAQSYNCNVEKYSGIVYLIPNEDNDFIGFSKGDLKKELCKSGANDKDYYLSQFIILTLLVVMYGSQGNSSKSRNYIRAGEFLNIVSDKLREGVNNQSESEQDKKGIAFSNILERFEALKSSDKPTKSKSAKEGFLQAILKFLESQDLIDYIEEDEMIKTKKKLDIFMDYNILNKNNYHRVLKALGEEANE